MTHSAVLCLVTVSSPRPLFCPRIYQRGLVKLVTDDDPWSIFHPISCSLCTHSATWLVIQCAMFLMYVSAGVVGGMFLCSRLEVPFLNQAQGSASSLPLLKPFQKQLYYSSQAHGTEEESRDSDVPIVIQGIDPVSTWCLKTCHTGGSIGSTLSSTGIVFYHTSNSR